MEKCDFVEDLESGVVMVAAVIVWMLFHNDIFHFY